MKLFLLVAIFGMASALPSISPRSEGVPSFTLLEDRSEDGSPNLSVEFADGTTDTIILEKYYANEEDKVQERMSGIEDCNYLGYLKNEKACLAMTGCIGSDEFREFTINTEHAGGHVNFRWFANNTVVRIPSILDREGGPKTSVVDPRKLMKETTFEFHGINMTLVGDEVEPTEQLEKEFEIEEFCFGGWGWCPSMPATMHMEYTSGYDDNFLMKTKSKHAAESMIKQTMTHVQPAFCAPGLGTKISMSRIGPIKHHAGYKFDGTSSFEVTKQFPLISREVGSADLVVLFGANTGPSGWAGMASKGSICGITSGFKGNINMWSPYGASDEAKIVRHEIGHNLGAPDYYSGSCTTGKPIMGGNENMRWGSCGKTAIESHYANYRWRWCMPENSAACRGSG